MARKPRNRRKEKKSTPIGRAYIHSTFNNTLITLTDTQGSVVLWGSAGTIGYKGSRKSTAFAAQKAGEDVGKKALEQGLKQVDVYVRGPGAGRETALRALQSRGFKILSIKDTTTMPHNGSRPPKKRRV
mgnify:CR=1 FL=1